MRRGEIRVIDLEPAQAGEANKQRPCVLVSNDHANTTADRLQRGTVTVVPLTSKVDRVYAFQVLFPSAWTGLRRDSKAQPEQVRAVAVGRVGRRIGQVDPYHLALLDDALRLHLQL